MDQVIMEQITMNQVTLILFRWSIKDLRHPNVSVVLADDQGWEGWEHSHENQYHGASGYCNPSLRDSDSAPETLSAFESGSLSSYGSEGSLFRGGRGGMGRRRDLR